MGVIVKVFGAMFIVFSTSAYGFVKCRELNNRMMQLKEIEKIIFLLKGEIEFGHTPIPEAFENVAQRCQTGLKGILTDFSAKLQKGNKDLRENWKEYMEKELKSLDLSRQEIIDFVQLGEILGLNEWDTQIKVLSTYENGLKRDIDELSESLPSKTKVYRSLGIMCGIIITIIIV